MKGNPIIQIKNCYDSLHNKEKMIADVILKNPEKIPYISVVDLTRQAETSCSSVVRFCKIMGYSGYSEFKTELAMYSYDLRGNLHYTLDEKDSSASTAAQNLFQLHSRELSAAADQIDCARLEDAADAMSSASFYSTCLLAKNARTLGTTSAGKNGAKSPSKAASSRTTEELMYACSGKVIMNSVSTVGKIW